MAKRNYSSTSDVRSLAAVMNATDTGAVGADPNRYTTITLNTISSTSNLPSVYPYTLVIDPDISGKEEIITVLSQVSTYVYNVNRASDGTSAVAHASAAIVKHMVTARDMQEPQEHINATGVYTVKNDGSNVSVTTATIVKPLHGLTTGDGNVVGTDASQTLTRKTLTNPTINAASLTGTITNSGTISGGTITATTAATFATARNINGVPFNGSADVTVPAAAGTLTGATLASGVTASSLTSFGSSATISGATISGTTTNSGTISGGSINGATLNAASTIGGVSGTTLAADQTGWTSWTPTTSWTLNGLTNNSKYKQVGKTVYFNLNLVSSGTITAPIGFTFTLPSQPLANGHFYGQFTYGGNVYSIMSIHNSVSTSASIFVPTATSLTANTPLKALSLTSSTVGLGTDLTAQGRVITVSGFYEVA